MQGRFFFFFSSGEVASCTVQKQDAFLFKVKNGRRKGCCRFQKECYSKCLMASNLCLYKVFYVPKMGWCLLLLDFPACITVFFTIFLFFFIVLAKHILSRCCEPVDWIQSGPIAILSRLTHMIYKLLRIIIFWWEATLQKLSRGKENVFKLLGSFQCITTHYKVV